MYEYAAQLVAVVDADTLKLDVDLGFRTHVRTTFRLARLNAPELLTLGGAQAMQFVSERLSQATALKIRSSRSEKYGRWLCELYYQTKATGPAWHNLNSQLLEAGHARPYKH